MATPSFPKRPGTLAGSLKKSAARAILLAASLSLLPLALPPLAGPARQWLFLGLFGLCWGPISVLEFEVRRGAWSGHTIAKLTPPLSALLVVGAYLQSFYTEAVLVDGDGLSGLEQWLGLLDAKQVGLCVGLSATYWVATLLGVLGERQLLVWMILCFSAQLPAVFLIHSYHWLTDVQFGWAMTSGLLLCGVAFVVDLPEAKLFPAARIHPSPADTDAR
jgi:hypothetical protein